MRSQVLSLFVACLAACSGPASAASPHCGCNQVQCATCNPASAEVHHHHHHGGCRKHRGGCNCCEQPSGGSRGASPRLAEIPSGPIADSMPIMRGFPMMMAMPMMPMMATRAVSFEEPRAAQPRTRTPERNCEESSDRIDELDARVEALNLRMKTIQRSVELQTRILEELRDQGSIGGKKVPLKTE